MAELEKDGRTSETKDGETGKTLSGSTGGTSSGSTGERTAKKPESGADGASRCGADEAEWQDLEKIWSRKRALQGLRRIFLLALEGARVEIRDKDGAVVDVKYNPSMANAATRAAEAANKMLGYIGPPDAEDGDAEDGAILVDFGDGEDYAG